MSYIPFANPKLHEAKQFSKFLSKSLDPSGQTVFSQLIWDEYVRMERLEIKLKCLYG